MAVDEGQKQKRTPFSARLPQASVQEVVPIVEALSALGVPSTPHVIAQQMGTSYATNSRFRTRLGAAGYYGFIRKDGERRALTPRGEALVGGDADAARQARSEAVMGTTFGPLIHSLRGRAVSENTISIRLQSENGVPEGSAPAVAKALVDAATDAGLIADGRFDAAAIEAAAAVMPAQSETPETDGGQARQKPETEPKPKQAPAPKIESKKATPKTPSATEKGTEAGQRPFVPGVQVVVKIDASNLAPQQIAELVRALQAPPEDS
jgi:hypothetical protein